MIYAEAAYFDGYAFQHIAAWQEHLRAEQRRREFLRSRAARERRILQGVGR